MVEFLGIQQLVLVNSIDNKNYESFIVEIPYVTVNRFIDAIWHGFSIFVTGPALLVVLDVAASCILTQSYP